MFIKVLVTVVLTVASFASGYHTAKTEYLAQPIDDIGLEACTDKIKLLREQIWELENRTSRWKKNGLRFKKDIALLESELKRVLVIRNSITLLKFHKNDNRQKNNL